MRGHACIPSKLKPDLLCTHIPTSRKLFQALAPPATPPPPCLDFLAVPTLMPIQPAEGDALAAITSESRMQGAVRRVTTTAALANAEGQLGAWAMGLHGFLAEVS